MVLYLIYGKIIIDRLHLPDGRFLPAVLGGGGPQALWGASLWSDSVGFLSRSGSDLAPQHEHALQRTGADLSGWVRYDDLPTLRGPQLDYDEDENMLGKDGEPIPIVVENNLWKRLLGRPLTLPPSYRRPSVVHLITEHADEPMVETALELREQGTLFSLEPLIDFHQWQNRDSMLELVRQVDIVSPDWPSASGVAGSNDPRTVVRFWRQFGPHLVAIRHGRHGSYVWGCDDGAWQVPALPTKVIDPTGAGNSYGGGLCVGWAETRDARMAACYATVSASFLLEQPGIPEQPPSLARAEARRRLACVFREVQPLQ
ncbi:MAG: PfkB family carbohydrate kinase [Chloroflexota bacterium]|nr:PfkB family carbohydrate kinase [Chloroflexota bacterium]